jgi:hypothetical protein
VEEGGAGREGGWSRDFDLDGEEERNWSSRLQLQSASQPVVSGLSSEERGGRRGGGMEEQSAAESRLLI